MNIHDNGILQSKWRVGRQIGRTIYAMVGRDATDADVLIGMMDEARDAKHVVDLHNSQFVTKVIAFRCLEDEGATGIQCYRTDEHEIHRGFHPVSKVWITWPVSRPYEQLTEQEGGPPNERING